MLLQDARKITFGGKIIVKTPHTLRPLLLEGGLAWMTTNRAFKYQMSILEDANVDVEVCSTLNPATFLPDPHGELPEHSCVQTLQTQWKLRPDLKDVPIQNADYNVYIDGSSFVEDGKRKTGYAVVSPGSGFPEEAQALPADLSAQGAELIAMIRALELGGGFTINIYSDSKWVVLLIHAHAIIYKERGMVDASGKEIRYKKLIEILFQAIIAPKQVAVMHVREHQKGNSETIKGNNAADRAAKEAAKNQLPHPRWYIRQKAGLWMAKVSEEPCAAKTEGCYPLIPDLEGVEETWKYEAKDKMLAEHLKATKVGKWWTVQDNRILVPHAEVGSLVHAYHAATHAGAEAMYEDLKRYFYAPNLSSHTRAVVNRCITCQITNPRRGRVPPPGQLEKGIEPMEVLQIDFTDMARCGRYRYLLVAVCTLTGWVCAKPCKSEKAREVVKWLLEDHIPCHGLPRLFSSDNGPSFVAKVVQGVCQALGIDWKLHAALHPASSGKVEKMNQTLKSIITKMIHETGMTWVELLPLALFKVRNTPGCAKITPFEAMYGRPSPVWRPFKPMLDQPRNIQSWAKAVNKIKQYLHTQIPLKIVDPVHNIQPGDWVLVKKWKQDPLTPIYAGPYQVVLLTPTAVKCIGIKAWVHVTRVKKVPEPQQWVSHQQDDLKLKLTKEKVCVCDSKAVQHADHPSEIKEEVCTLASSDPAQHKSHPPEKISWEWTQ